jgi:glycosyltransferase involved in cell wall biosynthesis
VLHVATPYGRNGPSSRVRVYEWLDRIAGSAVVSGYIAHHNASSSELARRPIAVLRAERRLRAMAEQRPERLLLHREASPLSRGKLERRLISSSGFSVYDFDDALQCDWGDGGRLRRIVPKAPKALIGVKTADRVIAGNHLLADWASQHSRDVVVIPSCVDPASYRTKVDYRVGDPPRIGWIGSRDNEIHLRLAEPALQEIHRRTGARLTVIGGSGDDLGGLEAFADRVPWSSEAQHLLAEFDVGLAPVPDDPYSRGKCGYKILQYAAAGTPVVGSPVGVNDEILRRLGMPAAGAADEWLDAILDLLGRSADAREAMGRAARKAVTTHYSYDAWLTRWEDALALNGMPARA